MRRWLLINTGGDAVGDLARADFIAFRSGDGDLPHDGDLEAAVLALARRRDIPAVAANLETLLVPLFEAQTMTFSIDHRASLVATGGLGG